jgi:hypothetical protein
VKWRGGDLGTGDPAVTAEDEANGPPEWLVATVRELRALGFFADPAQEDAEVARDLADDYAAEVGRPPEPDDDYLELELTRLDPERVWWEDTEADVGRGNEVYVDWIEGLARISRGALTPERISERWAGDEGPLHVRVDLPSGPVAINPHYLDDYVDVESVLRSLNEVVPLDGPRFAMYLPFDQTAFVVCITEAERRRLEERGWSFARLD